MQSGPLKAKTTILQENDVKHHDKVMGVWGKLKRDNVKVIKDMDNERMKREEDPCLQNRLAKGHIATRRKVLSLVSGSPTRRIPQPILTRDNT